MKHPNAAVGGGLPASLAVILFALRSAGVEVPDPPLEVGVALAGALSGAALLIGRRGIRGILRTLWRGSETEL